MRAYEVEVMAGEVPLSHKVTTGESPMAAAARATGQPVEDRRSENHRIRVPDHENRTVYKSAFQRNTKWGRPFSCAT